MRNSNRVAALFSAVMIWSTPASADFRAELAGRFNEDPRFFVLNIPPRPVGWPGSILTSDQRFVISRGSQNDPAVAHGPPFNMAIGLKVDLKTSANAGVINLFKLTASATDTVSTTFDIEQVRIHDMTIGDLRNKLIAVKQLNSTNNGGLIVIFRSYEGSFVMRATKNAGVDANAWAAFQKGVIDAGLTAAADAGDTLIIRSNNPIVFAFVTISISDLNAVLATIETPLIAPPANTSIRNNPNFNNPGQIIGGSNSIINNPGNVFGDILGGQININRPSTATEIAEAQEKLNLAQQLFTTSVAQMLQGRAPGIYENVSRSGIYLVPAENFGRQPNE